MSSRSRRRGGRRGGRKQQQRSRRSLPIVPIVVVVAVAGIVALVAFLVLQSGGSDSGEDLAAERDRSADLPGDFVELLEIYGGPYPETAGHVTRDVDYEGDGNSNPPAGGPHWSGGCGNDPESAPAFCGPAPWGIYRAEWEPETLVHNMEHGGVVVWYNTADQDVIDTVEALVEEKLNDDLLVVMAPYSDMEAETIAVTSWSRLDKFPVSEFTEERVEDFIDTHVRRFNPEHF